MFRDERYERGSRGSSSLHQIRDGSVAFLIGLVLGFGAGWAWLDVFNYAVAARFSEALGAGDATALAP
jgi:hypothetical protein